MRYFKLVLIVLFLPGLAIAQDTLTLEQAIQTGLENNYNIRIAEKNRAIDANNVHLGNAGFLPTLGVDATQTNNVTNTQQEYINGETINRDGATANSFNARAELRWTLFDGLEMFTTHDKLKEIRNKGKEEYKQAVLANMKSIMSQYYRVVREKQLLALRQQALALAGQRRDIAKTNYQVGGGSKLDYMQAKVDYNSDTSSIIKQREKVVSAKVRLNELLARSVEAEFTVLDTIPLQERLGYQKLVEDMVNKNPELNIAVQNRRISSLGKKNIQAQRYPDIGLNLGYDYSWSQSEAGFVSESRENGFDYGLFLSYPLFQGFNINRQKQNATIAVERANLAFEQKRQELRADLKVAYNNYANQYNLLEWEQENVEVARKNYNIAEASYDLGDASYLDVKEAQTEYLQAQDRLLQARYQTKQAELELLSLSGRLLQDQ